MGINYVFHCDNCNVDYEFEWSIRDYDIMKSRVKCEKCAGSLRRIFTPIGLTIYKGKGFYDTDSRGISAR